MNTCYTLFYDDPYDDFRRKKRTPGDFETGTVARYVRGQTEFLVIFLGSCVKLIFYCSQKRRKKIMGALLRFCRVMEPKTEATA